MLKRITILHSYILADTNDHKAHGLGPNDLLVLLVFTKETQEWHYLKIFFKW